VVQNLEAYGLDTIAIDLPGHGDDRGQLADLHGDAARVGEVLDGIDGPVVLVGHSYGGAVVTEAGVHRNVAHLVYLAAFAITEEESCSTAGVGEPATAQIDHGDRPKLEALMVFDDNGGMTLQPEGADEVFYNDCDSATAGAAIRRLDAQRLDSVMQTPRAVAWRTTPSTYVICTDDQAIHPDLQRVLALRCTDTVELPASHSPFLSMPGELTAVLIERANQY
jgi:pimeloyl-ACP methyl ester carboxylesterase